MMNLIAFSIASDRQSQKRNRMVIERFEIDGLLLIKPSVFSDERGVFYETYSNHKYAELGLPSHFAQDNESVSKKNVLKIGRAHV